MQDYINRLLTQFKEAKGITKVDSNSDGFREDFINFVIQKGQEGQNFRRYLEYLGLDHYRFASTAEYCKGNLDSIVKPSNSTIISPYGASFEGVDDHRIIVANLVVYGNTPVLLSTNSQVTLKYGEPFRTFMTHNPYTPRLIDKWEDLHNGEGYGIIYGVFGKISDLDHDAKVKTVDDLASKLNGDYTKKYDTDHDSYFCAVGTDFPMKKEKPRVLVKEREKVFSYR